MSLTYSSFCHQPAPSTAARTRCTGCAERVRSRSIAHTSWYTLSLISTHMPHIRFILSIGKVGLNMQFRHTAPVSYQSDTLHHSHHGSFRSTSRQAAPGVLASGPFDRNL